MIVRFKVEVRKENRWLPTEHSVTVDAPSFTAGQALNAIWEAAHTALLYRAASDSALLPNDGFRVCYEQVERIGG